jgi:predicted membrane-bound spermidine synthase
MSQALLAGISRTTEPRTMLRRFLALDAVVTGANGLAYALASGPLGRLLGVDAPLLLGLGVFLTAFAAGVGYLASRPQPPAAAVTLVVDANVLWAVLSVAALLAWLSPTTAGTLWIPVQAATVAGFAALQWTALRTAAARR